MCTRLQHRTWKTSRGYGCTRLQDRTCKTSRRHFASLVVSKKVPATYGDFDFFFQKISDFENWSWIFFHLKSFLFFLAKYSEWPPSKLIMTEVSRHLRNIFFSKIPPILKLEVGFFSDKKSFSQIFQNSAHLYHLSFIWKHFEQNQRTFFAREVGSSWPRLRRGG